VIAMTTVPVGRRLLLSERRRAVLGIAGVSVALLLILVFNGIVDGSMERVTRYIDTSPADVFVAQSGVSNMHMASSTVPLSNLDRIRATAGVAWAEPILYETDSLVASADQRLLSYGIGYEPGRPGGPSSLLRGSAPGPGEIALDDQAARDVGVGIGDRVRILGRSWRVSGLTDQLTNITSTISFVRFDDFISARSLPPIASYVLVGTIGSAQAVAELIAGETGLTALTKTEFGASERHLVRDMTAQIMQIMTLAAFIIGIAVIGLLLYAGTLSRLREIGVMKALGAGMPRLVTQVLSQAAWTIGVAFLLAIVLTVLLGLALTALGSNVDLALTKGSVLEAGVGGIVLGAIGALAPVARMTRVDPATVFRRPS
jgi:putative ABC transport system permease protein